MAKVIVRAPNEDQKVVNGVIAVNPNNEEYGSIMLESSSFVNTSGKKISNFINRQKRVAFISGETEILQAMVEQFDLTPNCDYSQKRKEPFCLIVKESTEPFFEGQSPKINPSNNEELHTPDGEPIYRQTFCVLEGSDSDTLLKHASEEDGNYSKEEVPAEYKEEEVEEEV